MTLWEDRKAFVYQVEYQCDGFLEKNKDTVNEEQINVLKTSKFHLLVMLLEEHENNTDTASSSSKMSRRAQTSKVHKKTVGLQSLTMLMDTLNATTPHYVRCIKPNDLKAPFTLEPMRTVQQLRSCGVLETIRISAAGFPSRWTYLEFFNRYRVLVKRKDVQPDCIQTCKTTLEKLIKDKDKYQFGKSKIFFRAGQVAYLESLRSDTLRRACVRVQKTLRCWLARKKHYRRALAGVVLLQSCVRRLGARRELKRLRVEARSVEHYKKLHGGMENKIIQLQRRLDQQVGPYIIFMCVRYADHLNDEERVSTLLNSTIITIKGVIKRRGHDFDTVSFWLANTCRFLHCLRQYSGDEDFTKHNTPRQNEHCLANFELSGYQQVFGDLVIQIYQQLVKCAQEDLLPLIAAGMLEHETQQGVLGSMPTGQRKRGTSAADEEAAITLETILQRLGQFHGAMGQHGMDPELVRQALRQLFHFICAVTLNHLLLRKDMCSWGKGLQLRYKVWQLEEWLVEKELAECGAKESLDPLIQAAQLLQINKKTPADAQAIVAMCTALTAPQ
ncbi:hypothetical protein CRUP_014171, partial [Coryphaenoides rupestris]